MKRYFFPLSKYKSGSSALALTPPPSKRYADDPLEVTVKLVIGASVTAIPVSADPSNAGRVPDKLAAARFVMFDPLIAAAVPDNCAAGKLVRFAPSPLNCAAVRTPDTLSPVVIPMS